MGFLSAAHSPDNSFMGFVVEQYLTETNAVEKPRKNLAVVYGKNTYMWQVGKTWLSCTGKTLTCGW